MNALDFDPKELKKLSKDQKLALLDALEEQKRRDRLKKNQFVPTPKQLAVIDSDALEKYLFCGNGFGKTCVLVNWIEWAAKGWNPITKKTTPVPSVIYLVVDDPSKIDQKIIPEYRKWFDLPEERLHKDGKPHISRISYKNGSVVHILTHEVNLLKLEGVEMTHIAYDEPPPRHVFLGLYRGGRIEGRPLQILMAGTPLYQAWLRTDIYEPWVDGDAEFQDIECFTGESADNSHINPEEYMRRFGKLLSEEEKNTRFKGEFFDLSGQALAQIWSPKVHIIPKGQFVWDRDNPCVVAIDPHKAKPHHAVLLGADKENRYYVLDEFSLKTHSRKFAKALVQKGWFRDYRVIDIIYDSYGNEEQSGGEGMKSFGQVFNEELKANGIGRARATSYEDKDDEDFVERIENVLVIPDDPDNTGQCLPKLRVLDHCRGLIRDIRQVQWQRDKKLNENKRKLDISNRDYLSCLKYGLATNLYYKKTKGKIYVPRKAPYGIPSRRKTTPKGLATFSGRGRRAS